MSNCCDTDAKREQQSATAEHCAPAPAETSPGGAGDSCCGPGEKKGRRRPDYLLWVSGTIVLVGYLVHWLVGGDGVLPVWAETMSGGLFELFNTMWWGLVAAVVFVGLLDRVPREVVMSALGRGGTFRGIFRATLAGVLLDLCSHGILMVGAKLYERGASLGQVMAFLVASPWNSLSLTIILVALIGLGWTLAFIALSMVIGIVTGMVFDRLVARGTLPPAPQRDGEAEPRAVMPALKSLLSGFSLRPAVVGRVLLDGIKDSRMVFRWLFFGLVLATAIRAFVPMDTYESLFGPTLVGLLLTTVFATIIEVCSEGATPIAADLLTRAAAPGNSFAFLMAGVATDYTEVMVIRDTTGSWKIALFLPLVCLPQVLVVGLLLNLLGGGV